MGTLQSRPRDSSVGISKKGVTVITFRFGGDDEEETPKTAEVSQMRPLKPTQIRNRSGAYVWQVNDLMKLQRFIFLGSDNSFCYKASNNEPKREDALCIDRLIAEGRGKEVVELIKAISLEGRAARQNPTIFALAVCARSNDKQTKQAAYEAFHLVCRIPTHLFMFIRYCEKESTGTGWGRAHRNNIIKWYMTKSNNPINVCRMTTKYKKREGFNHCDVLRLSHPKPTDHVTQVLFRYLTKGFKKMQELVNNVPDLKMDETVTKMVEFLTAVEKAKSCTDEDELVGIIDKYGLEREHMPTQLLNSKKVWEALIKNLKMEATIRNLGKITSLELCEKDSWVEKEIVERLTDQDLLIKSRTHPFKVLLALHTYKSGRGDKGSLRWSPNQAVLDALEKAYYMSFKAVEPTGKRFLLAIDVSGSMMAPCVGSSALTCKLASAAMMMVTMRTEENCDIVAFSHRLLPLEINKTDDLPTVIKKTDDLPFGGTDCALPMLNAQQEKKEYDVFIVYTDSETWYGKIHPSRALQQYREAMNMPDAKLIVVGMASNGFTIADPDDFGMLDIVGFDSGATQTIAKFSKGEM
ncbi:RO60-like protein [Mya arenaria]|uniref:RO60-like protein n=1 Tax=Mya arenaria TaxID=6604 RepID=A0ABY7DRQ8_MYAAR|nr:RNA-binding protein RO60-like [Mya arenaria]WAR00395.1 RO60-like protein [Mya arenaria]